MTSVFIYIQSEDNVLSETTISATRLITLELVVTIILLVGYFFHFAKIIVLAQKRQWWGLHEQLKDSRLHYVREHTRLINCSFV